MEDHCIDIHLVTVCNACIQFCLNCFANLIDSHSRVRSVFQTFYCVIFHSCPSTEHFARTHGTCARIINNLIKDSACDVALLNDRLSDDGFTIQELHMQSCVFACCNNGVNGKMLCSKCALCAVGRNILHDLYRTIVFNMNDIGISVLLYADSVQSHLYFFQRLDLHAVFKESNINSFDLLHFIFYCTIYLIVDS